MDDEKIDKALTGLEICAYGDCEKCPYKEEKDETYSGFCTYVLERDAFDSICYLKGEVENLKAEKGHAIELIEGAKNFNQQCMERAQRMDNLSLLRVYDGIQEGLQRALDIVMNYIGKDS